MPLGTEEMLTDPLYVKVTVMDIRPDNKHGTVAIEYTAGAGIDWAISLLRACVEGYDDEQEGADADRY